jgi:hypothetical protein
MKLCIMQLYCTVHFVQMASLKVHKRENFLGFDFEICTFS